MNTKIFTGVTLKELLCEDIFDDKMLIDLRKTIDSCPQLDNSYINIINIKKYNGPRF